MDICYGNQDVVSISISIITTDSKIHGANMGPTWVLSSPSGPHVGPMNLAVWDWRQQLTAILDGCKIGR